MAVVLHMDVNGLVTVRTEESQVGESDNMVCGVSRYWYLVMSLDVFDPVPAKKIYITYIANPYLDTF